jgi:hypothetical protein
MPKKEHILMVAGELAKELNGKAFLSIERLAITEKLRRLSGEGTTRIKALLGRQLERELSNQGIRCFPSLSETTTGDRIRLFHTGTVVASLVDMLVNPGPHTDKELGVVTKKVKGMWEWQRESA